jgi:aerobic-type carbon monoxide dehydrogenase small subunit (CoxS/CutS family)
MKRTVELTVNGDAYRLDVEPNRRLLDVLREELGLTGTKEGCSIGVCGACTVQVDGDMISSCLMLTVNANGCQITTIEGLAQGEQLHALQRAFIDHGGFQCGICTPGQIMAAKALLDQHPHPTREEVVEWMTGNLCRCTGYYKIIESIMAVVDGVESRAPSAR